MSERILGLWVDICPSEVLFYKIPVGFLLKLFLFSFYMGNLLENGFF